ncbi:MAG: right-handed parallel beta-helix repeat-containing protein [Phycisphaerales bacterium]|nr:MAG: right-handed parallel beta-helix repeat-containing protein [Phycisphaerales bacterium]
MRDHVNRPTPGVVTEPPLTDGTTQRRALLAGIGGLAAGAFLTRGAAAGDLNPPAGPVQPTMKRLDEIEPRIPIGPDTTPGDSATVFRITQPGSYYLTGNELGQLGKDGIIIEANDVTIDLMGFTLRGVSGAGRGIRTIGARSRITVRNGNIVQWGLGGVLLFNGGIELGSRVEGVTAASNGADGIRVGINGVVRGCTTDNNSADGISAGESSFVTECCARSNTGSGVNVGPRSVVIGCSCASNGSFGISTQNLGRSIVSHCAATSNTLAGIRVFQECFVTKNVCAGNNVAVFNGTGILVSGGQSRIEENNCTGNHSGIRVTTAGNLIARNTSGANVINWDVVAGNVCLVVAAAVSGQVFGNSGGVSPGSTNPNANFTY